MTDSDGMNQDESFQFSPLKCSEKFAVGSSFIWKKKKLIGSVGKWLQGIKINEEI